MTKLKNRFIIIVILISLTALFKMQSCKEEPIGIQTLDSVCYDTQIETIFSSSCAISGCHTPDAHKARFDATSYSEIFQNLTPGNPWKSKLYSVVSSPNDPNFMPPSGHKPLSQNQRTLIEVWILQGAKNKHCSIATP